MKKPSLLIIGSGAIGNAIAAQNSSEPAWRLLGARRRADKLAPGMSGYSVDYTDAPAVSHLLSECAADYLLLTFTPQDYSNDGYQSSYLAGTRNVLAALQHTPTLKHSLKRIVFVSSTSVYGQHNEELVDEYSDATPGGFSGRVMLQCEDLLAGSDIPATSLRCGGIYSQQSTRLLDAIRQGSFSRSNQYTNRIHRYDCAAAIMHLLNLDVKGRVVQNCYLGVDSEPVRKQEVERWLAQRLGIAFSESNPTGDAASASQRSVGSKRCSNQRLLNSGFQFRYPSFREGYGEIIDALTKPE